MRQKLYRHGGRVDKFDNYNWDKEKKLPGPGYYAHPETIGSRMMSSTFVTSRQASFPKASDRFRVPVVPKSSPAPDNYTP